MWEAGSAVRGTGRGAKVGVGGVGAEAAAAAEAADEAAAAGDAIVLVWFWGSFEGEMLLDDGEDFWVKFAGVRARVGRTMG